MTIVHYSLGLSPQRSGGMTKYSTDLIVEQQRLGYNSLLLYPSGYQWWSRKIKWRSGGLRNGIRTIMLGNSLPVPLLYGIRSPRKFISGGKMSVEDMESLYQELRPDVFHVHTLMGLPKELLLFLKTKGVRLVFTTHDYFGICTRVNMIDHTGEPCTTPSPEKCALCNRGSKSLFYLRLRNSKIALRAKQNRFIRKLLS